MTRRDDMQIIKSYLTGFRFDGIPIIWWIKNEKKAINDPVKAFINEKRK